jgi:hypothetical protein
MLCVNLKMPIEKMSRNVVIKSKVKAFGENRFDLTYLMLITYSIEMFILGILIILLLKFGPKWSNFSFFKDNKFRIGLYRLNCL